MKFHKSILKLFLASFMIVSCSNKDEHSENDFEFSLVKFESPVIQRSKIYPDWKGLATADACVISVNDTLKAWFSGSGWLANDTSCGHVRIGYAWSLDGINWNEYIQNPVLNRSDNSTDFDYDGVETPTVIYDENAQFNERYKMWYAGRSLSCSNVQDHKIGYAYSPDGINWTKYTANPVIVPGGDSSWYNTAVYGPSVIYEGNIYKMWFTGMDTVLNNQSTDGKANILYATSINGINWSIHSEPVLVAGEQSEADLVVCAEPSVVKINGVYHMFYSSLDQWDVENFQVSHAWSVDGILWNKSHQNPLLLVGNVGEWDSYWASHPAVFYNNLTQNIQMWYTGRDNELINDFYNYYWDIGYAELRMN
ncbi:MAG: hypothetical protein KYX68_07670 [Flavobacterium sp.]|nr:hypothetical protein [Flavobacterium sp.]